MICVPDRGGGFGREKFGMVVVNGLKRWGCGGADIGWINLRIVGGLSRTVLYTLITSLAGINRMHKDGRNSNEVPINGQHPKILPSSPRR